MLSVQAGITPHTAFDIHYDNAIIALENSVLVTRLNTRRPFTSRMQAGIDLITKIQFSIHYLRADFHHVDPLDPVIAAIFLLAGDLTCGASKTGVMIYFECIPSQGPGSIRENYVDVAVQDDRRETDTKTISAA